VKKITSQNYWPRIHLGIKQNQNRSKLGFTKPFFLFCGASRIFFENVPLVARRRKHVQVPLTIVFVAELPPKRCF